MVVMCGCVVVGVGVGGLGYGLSLSVFSDEFGQVDIHKGIWFDGNGQGLAQM